MFRFFEKKLIENEKDTEEYVEKIKRIENFQNMSEEDIVQKITDMIIKSFSKSGNNFSLINEPNVNVDKFNPSLNNKNNTNFVANSFPNTVAPGFLNPVKRLTQNQNLNLNYVMIRIDDH
jgi:hypothetical protein